LKSEGVHALAISRGVNLKLETPIV